MFSLFLFPLSISNKESESTNSIRRGRLTFDTGDKRHSGATLGPSNEASLCPSKIDFCVAFRYYMLQWMVTGCPDVMASSLRSNGTIRGMTNSVENNSIIIS